MKLVNKANDVVDDISKYLDNGTTEPFNEVECLLTDACDMIKKLVEDNIRLTDKLIEYTKND